MNRHLSIFLLSIFTGLLSTAQQPELVGYWHNWNDALAPYVQLDQIDLRYTIIDVAFATPQTGTDYQMEFIPDQVSALTLQNQIQTLQSQGKKVLISIGGATAPISLDNTNERNVFISTMNTIINSYGFDGIDIDLESSSISVSGGSISMPTDVAILNMRDAIRQIMSDYFSSHGKHMMFTMAPETAFVQGGQSAYGGIWGAYLPLIDALRDSIDLLHVQLYNSGSMYGLDGNIYSQGNADFLIAMTEAVIRGFNTSGGHFFGLPASKVAIGLPACGNAAGGGFVDTAQVKSAVDYLRGLGPKPGTYTLFQVGGYPDLGGLMTWSINWDAVNTCESADQFARNFERIFGSTTSIANANNFHSQLEIYPNPVIGFVKINTQENSGKDNFIYVYNLLGELKLSASISPGNEKVNLSSLSPGIYFLKYQSQQKKLIKE